MPAEVHLPEPVLGVDESLGQEQIVGGFGLDGGHTRFVTVDGDRRVESRQ